RRERDLERSEQLRVGECPKEFGFGADRKLLEFARDVESRRSFDNQDLHDLPRDQRTHAARQATFPSSPERQDEESDQKRERRADQEADEKATGSVSPRGRRASAPGPG